MHECEGVFNLAVVASYLGYILSKLNFKDIFVTCGLLQVSLLKKKKCDY